MPELYLAVDGLSRLLVRGGRLMRQPSMHSAFDYVLTINHAFLRMLTPSTYPSDTSLV